MPPCAAAVVATRKRDNPQASPRQHSLDLEDEAPTAKLLAAAKQQSSQPAVKKPEDLGGLHTTPPAEEVKGPSGRVYTGESCCCFKPADMPRRWAIQFVESKPFDPVILITIICNCATMAWESPLDPCCTPKADFIDVRRLAVSRPRRLRGHRPSLHHLSRRQRTPQGAAKRPSARRTPP